MEIGKEHEAIEVPLPVHPDDVPEAQPQTPVTTPEKVPA